MGQPTKMDRVRSAGQLTGAALLALDRGIRKSHPELFAEVSMQLHESLNELTKLAMTLMEDEYQESVAKGDES